MVGDFYYLLSLYLQKERLKKVDLAKKLKVTATYVVNLTNKETRPPGFDRCAQMSEIFGLTGVDRLEFLASAWIAKLSEDDRAFFEAYSEFISSKRDDGKLRDCPMTEVCDTLQLIPPEKRKHVIEAVKSMIKAFLGKE